MTEAILDTTGDGISLNQLDELFDEGKTGEAETIAEPVETLKGEPETVTAVAEPEPATEQVAETPSAKDAGLQAALVAERKKRQEAETRLKEFQSSSKLPDPISDPDGYADGLKSQVNQESVTTRITLSRDLMIDTKPDYLEKEAVFMGIISDKDGNIVDESLHQKFLASHNPARFAYNYAVEQQEVQKLKDPAYIEQIRKSAYEEGLKAAGTKPKHAVTELPDITNATASGKNSTPVIRPITLDEVMADSPF